ncbi:MAG: RelA/SpoT domain-containing protein [Candidatus Omnitrophica bacterium]|nr:RelA/SpoT domain-containing protein [Candidatus Omnitrophota bacterium]
MENEDLRKLIHSIKVRKKDPKHLKDKLERIARRNLSEKKPFRITAENLFSQINDLAGIRILHLHTKQMLEIHPAVLKVFREHFWTLIRKPVAYTWDIENKAFFQTLGIKAVFIPSQYTSVHYILKPKRETPMTCELQIRTLMEEVWGEVSHVINYPYETKNVHCKEQLRVLARIASGCTRLVDSIFESHKTK